MKIVGGKIGAKEHNKLRHEDAIDNILDRLIFAKPLEMRNVRKDCLFLPHQMGPMWMRGVGESDLMFATPEDVNHPELVWPLSVGAVWPKQDEGCAQSIQCNYWESVAPKVLRGKYRFVGKYNIGYFHGQFIEENKFLSAVEYGSWSFGRWRSAQRLRFDEAFLDAVPDAGTAPIARYVDKGEDDVGILCALGASIGLTYRYEWGAQFSIGNSARVIVPTTPEGIKQLFDDRDKPEYKDRRSAIRHWVKEHLRRKSTQDFSSVRRHMRGETQFSWRGFDVKICPSQYDIEKNLVRY